jgi:hypothetical protein
VQKNRPSNRRKPQGRLQKVATENKRLPCQNHLRNAKKGGIKARQNRGKCMAEMDLREGVQKWRIRTGEEFRNVWMTNDGDRLKSEKLGMWRSQRTKLLEKPGKRLIGFFSEKGIFKMDCDERREQNKENRIKSLICFSMVSRCRRTSLMLR